MPQDSNTHEPSYEAFIVDCMEPVRALARKYSRDSYRIECDDLFSIGMVKVCEVAARAPAVSSQPRAYALRCAEKAMIEEYWRVHRLSPLSLDTLPLDTLLSSSNKHETYCLRDVLSSSFPDDIALCQALGVVEVAG
jgi:DNA-directed RNA polymerase specialized sigma24 family protein